MHLILLGNLPQFFFLFKDHKIVCISNTIILFSQFRNIFFFTFEHAAVAKAVQRKVIKGMPNMKDKE